MTRTRFRFVALFALALGTLGPASAAAAEKAKGELRVPAAPSQSVQEQLAGVLGAIDPELHAPFQEVVDDAKARLRASQRAVGEGKGEPLAIRDACRAALKDADFAKITKRSKKVLEAVVDLAVLQLTVDLHAGLREGVGRQLAMRSVRACGGKAACLDAIAPTDAMQEHHIIAVRTAFAGKTTELAAAEQLGEVEVAEVGAIYNRMYELYSKIMANAHEMKKAIIANFPR